MLGCAGSVLSLTKVEINLYVRMRNEGAVKPVRLFFTKYTFTN